MGRKKVRLAFITNDVNRRATNKKRKKGFFKKAEELSKLCGIDLFAILYGPSSAQPADVYSSTDNIQSLISKFKSLTELEQTKRMVNHENFTQQRIMKARKKLRNQQKKNREKELSHYMYQCLADDRKLQSFGLNDLIGMSSLIDQKLKEITRKMAVLNKKNSQQLDDQPSTEGGNTALSLAATSNGDENKKDPMVASEMPEAEKQIVKKMDINTDEAGPSNN